MKTGAVDVVVTVWANSLAPVGKTAPPSAGLLLPLKPAGGKPQLPMVFGSASRIATVTSIMSRPARSATQRRLLLVCMPLQ